VIVRVQLFAVARQLAGEDAIDLDLPPGATVADVRTELLRRTPALAPLARHLLFSVDADYAADGAVVPEGAEVACIPPVSGG
jgi:sulfur-carrier protein